MLERAKSFLRRLGKLEKSFLALLVVYVLVEAVAPTSLFAAVLQIAVIVLGLWLLIRVTRVAVRRSIWRLRNRLLMTYLFIAVVPILLILAFVGLGSYALSSQLAVYLVTSELDRRIAALTWLANGMAAAGPALPVDMIHGSGEVLKQQLFDPTITIRQHGTMIQSWPVDREPQLPPSGWADASGILLHDGRFYAWAHAVRADTDVTITAPLTRAFLDDVLPGLGDVRLFVFGGGPASRQYSPVNEPAATHLVPPSNIFDVVLRGASFLPFSDWNVPGKTQNDGMISVQTRPSALLGTVFNAKVDAVQQTIPAILFGVGILFLVVQASSLVTGVSLARTITAAVHELYTGTQRVMQGDFSHPIRVSKSRDQLASLSASFNTMTENLERLLAVAKEKERLQTELEIAREVQEQLYPKEIPSMKTMRLTAFWQSARIVSGDYFDYQRIGDEQLALAIGDVAGKGISAALLMATIQSAMRMELRTELQVAAPSGRRVASTLSSARIVSDLNQQLHLTTPVEKFATFCFGIYDETSGAFKYTNAGHLPPILVHNGAATRLDVNGMVVGAFPFARYDESTVHLERGDMLVFFTDGITEPENEYGEMFGEERLVDIFVKNADRHEEEIIASVMEAVRQWTDSPERQDDMTFLVARRL